MKNYKVTLTAFICISFTFLHASEDAHRLTMPELLDVIELRSRFSGNVEYELIAQKYLRAIIDGKKADKAVRTLARLEIGESYMLTGKPKKAFNELKRGIKCEHRLQETELYYVRKAYLNLVDVLSYLLQQDQSTERKRYFQTKQKMVCKRIIAAYASGNSPIVNSEIYTKAIAFCTH